MVFVFPVDVEEKMLSFEQGADEVACLAQCAVGVEGELGFEGDVRGELGFEGDVRGELEAPMAG